MFVEFLVFSTRGFQSWAATGVHRMERQAQEDLPANRNSPSCCPQRRLSACSQCSCGSRRLCRKIASRCSGTASSSASTGSEQHSLLSRIPSASPPRPQGAQAPTVSSHGPHHHQHPLAQNRPDPPMMLHPARSRPCRSQSSCGTPQVSTRFQSPPRRHPPFFHQKFAKLNFDDDFRSAPPPPPPRRRDKNNVLHIVQLSARILLLIV